LIESTIEAINKAFSVRLLDIQNTILASPGGPTTLSQESKGAEGVGANWDSDGDANLSLLKAPLNLSRKGLQRGG
jgi:hypothetical protein